MVAPLAVSGVLHLVGDLVTDSAGALVLVLVVVGAAATGDRIAGVVAAVSSAVGFDFFLTRPYLQLRIDSAEDVELAVLLLCVGVAVSELASWGIRQSVTATRQAGYMRGVLESALLAGGSVGVEEGLERVSEGIRTVLGAEAVRFVYGDHDAGCAVIHPDGTVHARGEELDVEATGLPSGPSASTVVPIAQGGAQVGYFDIRPGARPLRVTREQLRVAALLAAQWSLRPIPRASRAGRHTA